MILWLCFAILSAAMYALGSTEAAMDYRVAYVVAGVANAVVAATLIWRHGLSLATPIVIGIYVWTNSWFLLYLLLSATF